MLIEKIQSTMKDVCSRGAGQFDTVFYEKHIRVMAQIADTLAGAFQADREIVVLAAYLHDISAMEDYASVARHHILGGKRAEEILSSLGYPPQRIAAVRQCISRRIFAMFIMTGGVWCATLQCFEPIVCPQFGILNLLAVNKSGFPPFILSILRGIF